MAGGEPEDISKASEIGDLTPEDMSAEAAAWPELALLAAEKNPREQLRRRLIAACGCALALVVFVLCALM